MASHQSKSYPNFVPLVLPFDLSVTLEEAHTVLCQTFNCDKTLIIIYGTFAGDNNDVGPFLVFGIHETLQMEAMFKRFIIGALWLEDFFDNFGYKDIIKELIEEAVSALDAFAGTTDSDSEYEPFSGRCGFCKRLVRGPTCSVCV